MLLKANLAAALYCWRHDVRVRPIGPPAGAAPAGTKRTLIKAGHVLDVKTGKLADAQTIVVVGETIQSIAPTASISPQPGDTVSTWAA